MPDSANGQSSLPHRPSTGSPSSSLARIASRGRRLNDAPVASPLRYTTEAESPDSGRDSMDNTSRRASLNEAYREVVEKRNSVRQLLETLSFGSPTSRSPQSQKHSPVRDTQTPPMHLESLITDTTPLTLTEVGIQVSEPTDKELELEAQYKQKDKELTDLIAFMMESDRYAEVQNKEVESLTQALKDSQMAVENLNAEVKGLKEALAAKDNEIKALVSAVIPLSQPHEERALKSGSAERPSKRTSSRPLDVAPCQKRLVTERRKSGLANSRQPSVSSIQLGSNGNGDVAALLESYQNQLLAMQERIRELENAVRPVEDVEDDKGKLVLDDLLIPTPPDKDPLLGVMLDVLLTDM
ncbi:hypothetical protein GMRT_23070 [Giardia muris]|uniref:Uncharacterized protein n=1 Tax=Giardia muris TaxID=5742 RepID=A0A4Z1SR94_GIAMU|nr:hypothetical protein GMRT_23070 [Giardia muris]|eukprot:TNJ27485.1 hypothetical protein GMRT_23070 [Giardia muris]